MTKMKKYMFDKTDELKKMCDEFGFKLGELGDKFTIDAKNDKWGINIDSVERGHVKLVLYHFHTIGGVGWHRQTKDKMNLEHIFKYIARHETKLFRPGEVSIFR